MQRDAQEEKEKQKGKPQKSMVSRSATEPSGPVRPAQASVSGKGVPPELLQKVVAAKLGDVEDCYERELAVSPGARGKVVVAFTVDASGAATRAQVVETFSASLGECMVGAVGRWRFPAPTDGGLVRVTYPFHFEPP